MKIIVCGCSFSATVEGEYAGTHWSEVLAKKLDAELINYARQGISNAAIRVQIDEAMKQNPDYVFVGATTEDRIEIPLKPFTKIQDGHPNHTAYKENRNGYVKELGLKNFNYGVQHPYTMISETIFSIIENYDHNYRIGKVDKDIRTAVEEYAAFMYDAHWKKQCDRWIIDSGLWRLHDAGIKFLYNPWVNASPNDFDMPQWFQDKYFVPWQLGFGRIANDYPYQPDIGYHTSPEGQAKLAELYYELIKERYPQ